MIKLCFSSLIRPYFCIWLVQFSWFLCSTNISTRACACVRVMWKSCFQCEETQLSESSEEMFWVMMADVCACGPGQQHLPAGRSWSSSRMLFIRSTEQLQSSDLKVELDGCWKPSISLWPTRTERTHFLRRDWLSDWLKRIKKCVNKEQPF